MERTKLSGNIRRLLKIQHKTQASLSEKLGLSRQSVSNYVSGAVIPDAIKLGIIADFFDVSTDFLLGRTAYPRLGKPNLQAAVDYTGLSPEAAAALHNMTTAGDPSKEVATVDALLTHKHGKTALQMISAYLSFDGDIFRTADGSEIHGITVCGKGASASGLYITADMVRSALLLYVQTALAEFADDVKEENKNGK